MTSCCLYENGPELFDEQWRMARKQHKCCECGDYIPPGMQYQYISGLWDGMWLSFKTCEKCADLRDSLSDVLCTAYGFLAQDYTDYITHGAAKIVHTGTHAAKLTPDFLVDKEE